VDDSTTAMHHRRRSALPRAAAAAVAGIIALSAVVSGAGPASGSAADTAATRSASENGSLTLAALITFLIAQAFPIVELETNGITSQTTLIGAIVGEFVAGERGLGYVILTSQATFNSPRAFAAIILLSVIGTIMFFIVELCERWLLPWHVSQRSAKAAR